MAIIAPLLIVSCTPKKTAIQEKQPENYVILINMDDRLLNNSQAEQDIALIIHIFEKYESVVRNNLIINSKDKFRIVIAPQENMEDININHYENSLFLDMSKFKTHEKVEKLENFKAGLKNELGKLYGEVTKNRTKHSDYKGAHIWKYYNDNLSSDIKEECMNRLFIITDGYFDFESSSARKTEGNRTTTSNFLNKVRGKTNWKELIEKHDYGIIPIEKTFHSLSVCILEINPKYSNLDEMDMLHYIWHKWLGEMNIKNIYLIPHSGLSKIKGQIDCFLELKNDKYED